MLHAPKIVTHLNKRQITLLAASAMTVAALLVLAFLPPFVGPEAGDLIMAGFRKVCHQLPSRSFHIGETQVALCHRCVGIYAAIPLATALFFGLRRWDAVLNRYPLHVVALALVPMGLDWGGDLAGLWTNTPLSRLLTGAVFGIVAGYFLARGIVHAADSRASDEKEISAESAPV